MKRIDFEELPITSEARGRIFFQNGGQFGIRQERLTPVSAN